METAKLKKFAQFARRSLIEQVSAKLKLVLAENSAARRESAVAIKKLDEAIKNNGKEQVIERVAYIWFNRFCALRFMDVNRYTRIGVVSPAEGQFQPEILAEAKMGHIDEDMVNEKSRQQINDLLSGKFPSDDAQGEAYRKLVVAACNYWNKAMPFLFERIADYTELLMPDDLLSGNSILAYTREAMTPDACKDPKTEEPIVEVIGWLYQFYISEKKDEVFDGLKKNKKITPENIPAATQLFTPHWIVRYLVENSLGRLWLLNRPGSKLIEKMDYYIKPEQVETDFLRIGKPEEIKICDPACGSGHMLTYAFDLLYAIYEEEGYESADIPEKILTHNLYGIEIDERAGELAAFAMTMKARAKQRRFFNKGVKPNICVLQNIDSVTHEPEWPNVLEVLQNSGVDRNSLIQNLTLFGEANNFGSLLRPTLTTEQAQKALAQLTAYDESVKTPMIGHRELIDQCKTALVQADYLSPKYHVVVANPPYMGGGGMNGRLKVFSQENYQDSRADLFAMFIERNLDLTQDRGSIAMITMQSWMFLSSFETLRAKMINSDTILSMAHLGSRAFDSIGGEVVSTTAFVIKKAKSPEYKGSYIKLTDGNSEAEKKAALLTHQSAPYFVSTAELKTIPGSPIAYWINEAGYRAFSLPPMSEVGSTRRGLQTGNKDEFIRNWFECETRNIEWRKLDKEDVSKSEAKWFQFNNGGNFRKWYGNLDLVVNWQNDGDDIKNSGKAIIPSEALYFKPAVCWARLTTGNNAFRLHPHGIIPGDLSPCFYSHELDMAMAYYNSKCANYFLNAINPTITKTVGDVARIPSFDRVNKSRDIIENTKELIYAHNRDWDSYETSWDFTILPILQADYRQPTLKATYQKLRAHWREMTLEMQRLEQENNRIFIEAYGLKDELDEKVDLNEITLTCNPHYRYGNDKSENELEALLLADTMRELVSYAVGCMFGRYALDKPGLILANQGETIEDYLKRIPEPSFPADDDNVIPMLDGDWFTDDIAERFRKFLRVAFGEENYEENLRFVEKALGKNGKARDIRDYFLKDFYSDHVKRYKKRPNYWLFSSPKGSFNALIYMHRYRPDTVSVVLNDYLREFRNKLTSHKNHLEAVSISASASQGEKTKALKEIEKVNKMITEVEEYEREVLYPLATEQKEIDLDDGVKVNYPKFGAALKKISGLDKKEE
jgi:type II restriction/modification system DNA methylase subunit YeeA